MKKHRILCALLALVIALALLTSAVLAEDATEAGGLGNFTEKNKFTDQTFADVSTGDWFYTNVAYVYVYGLMNGTSDTAFNPKGNVKLSEAITVAARLNMIYTTGAEVSGTSAAGSNGKWYDQYVDYAKENGIIESDYEDYEKAATRAEFAQILAAALPDEALDEINLVVDNAIPDVSSYEDYADAVYKLYRAGIIVGNDDKGTFNPDRSITRAEVSAIISRMISREQRKSVTLTSAIEKIFDDDGNLTHECTTHYNEKGLPVESYEVEYEWDDDGTVADDENNIVYAGIKFYNEYGLIASLHERYAGGDLHSIEYTYDDSLNLVKQIEKDKNGDVTYKYTAVYNEDNLLIKSYEWYDDGTETDLEIIYNDSNSPVKVVKKTNARKTTIECDYNDNGYPIKFTRTIRTNGIDKKAESSFTYNDDNKITKLTLTSNINGYNEKETCSFTYNNKNKITKLALTSTTNGKSENVEFSLKYDQNNEIIKGERYLKVGDGFITVSLDGPEAAGHLEFIISSVEDKIGFYREETIGSYSKEMLKFAFDNITS